MTRFAAAATVAVTVAVSAPLSASAALFAATASAQPASAPGTVTEVSALPAAVSVPEAGASYALTYWSRGPRGPMLSSGAVYLPPGDPPAHGWPVVAYAHGSVGIADRCAFTTIRRDYYLGTVYPELLRAGYAVMISDYVGLGTPGTHPYLDGPSQARSVIDGVRAARAHTPELARSWAVLGQSQGGQTALFAANIAPADAPELDLRGVAATGPPSNLELLAPLLGPWVPRLPLKASTAYFAMILAGVRATAPELDVNRYLTPTGRRVLDIVEDTCVTDADPLVRDVSIGQMLAGPLDDPALRTVADAMLRIPTTGYTVPLFVGQGLADAEVPVPLSAKLVADLALGGADLQVGIYAGDHLGAARAALPDAVAFLHRVLDRP